MFSARVEFQFRKQRSHSRGPLDQKNQPFRKAESAENLEHEQSEGYECRGQ